MRSRAPKGNDMRSRVLAAFGVFLAACASYDTHPIQLGGIEDYEKNVTVDRIAIAVDVYDSSWRTKMAFDEDLVSEGYVAVNLIVRNGTKERILITWRAIELVTPSGQIHRPIKSAIVAEDFEDNKMLYALFGFGIFSYMSAADANEERERDWLDKEIEEDFLLGPGRIDSGVVYFKLSAKPRGSILRVVVERMSSNETTELQVRL